MTEQLSTIWTIGHGTRSGDELVQMLQKAGVQCLVDVRSYPVSRRNPQFSREQLVTLLSSQGIKYKWEGEGLGGFRKARLDSRHIALSNEGFRGYADYMELAEFKQAIELLINDAEQTKIAYMCTERLPWRCHRSLISDYLVTQGVTVMHLVAPGKTQEHAVNPVVVLREGELIYDKTAQMRLEV
jgi:uncharacterized protein (DUF488 family)